ncbi:hypothetical protein [Microbacterium sp. 77mftsu3.1]|uniref:hypothetical protein n=1 Tax=Microbacterium sp. 77mftsu3.1 TaxID=1761802 RepID=UPI00037E517B|nr:hypothetical protein [Microbacterium sp. 77mftsu3.1]SDH43367.1 hypothetical protein SAMN04488590_3334 [Microbacterium sp. 77mftsu3.1]
MKLADLKLDTVYVDHDERPLVLLSLDKVKAGAPLSWHGPATIEDAGPGARSWGALVLRADGISARQTGIDALLDAARPLLAHRPEVITRIGSFTMEIVPLRLIIRDWDDHLIAKQMEAERRAAAEKAKRRERSERAALIARIEGLLPDGVTIKAYDTHDHTQVKLTDLLTILESRAPKE